MQYVIDSMTQVRNICVLSKPFIKTTSVDRAVLNAAFIAYLQTYYTELAIIPDTPLLVDNLSEENRLIKFFQQDSILNDKNQTSMLGLERNEKVKVHKLALVTEALNKIAAINQELYDLITLYIKKIFIGNSSKVSAGSSSAAIGVICLNFPLTADIYDVIELIVHEYSHNVMFIDERVYGHYSDYKYVADPAYFAPSAILKQTRPLDKVVHSIVVATQILMTRALTNFNQPQLHPDTITLVAAVDKSIAVLLNTDKYADVFSPRLITILTTCNKFIKQLIIKQAA